MAEQRKYNNNPLGFLPAVIMLVLAFVALYYVASGVFWILSLIAPVLLIITLFVDYTVVVNYGKWIWELLQKNFIAGLGVGAMTFFGFPVVAAFLLGKALLKKKVKSVKEDFDNRKNGEYVEYEEVDPDTNVQDVEFEEIEEMELEDLDDILPPKTRQKEIRGNNNEYDQLFD